MSRRRGGHSGGGHASSERWLLTYADLITLLLVFFVVMFALSQVDKDKYQKLKQSLSQSSIGTPAFQGNPPNPAVPMPGQNGVLPAANALVSLEQQEMQRISKEVEQLAKMEGMEGEIKTDIDKQGMTISISNAGFFEPGEATLQPAVVPILDRIAKQLKSFSHKLRIEGHTDNIPIATPKYPSNWELSAVRATTIVRFLAERHGYDGHQLSAAGYGEYYPKVANDTEAHRAQNRRVDIVVLRDDQDWKPAQVDR